MPQDLTKRTQEEREADVRYLTTLPLSDLRKRQRICEDEKELIYSYFLADQIRGREDRFGNHYLSLAMRNIDEKERDLIDAIDRKEFGQHYRKNTRARIGSVDHMKSILSGTTMKGVPMLPPRVLKLKSGNSILLDGREYKEKYVTNDLKDAVEFAEKLVKTHDVYITYSGSLYNDDSNLIYVYAAPEKTKQTKMSWFARVKSHKHTHKVSNRKRTSKPRKTKTHEK